MSESKKPIVFGLLVVIRRQKMEDGSRFPVSTTECTIGRGENCTVRVHLPSVSKLHCQINSSKDQKSVLKNMSADSNLNGRKLSVGEEVTLEHGDHMGLADRVIRWEYSKSSPFHPSKVTWTAQGETDNKRIGDKLEARSRSSNRMVAVVPPIRRSHSESKADAAGKRSRSMGSSASPGTSADFSRVTMRRGGVQKLGRSMMALSPKKSLLLKNLAKSTPNKVVEKAAAKTPLPKSVSKSRTSKVGLAAKSASKIGSARKTAGTPYSKSAIKSPPADGASVRRLSPSKISFATPEATSSVKTPVKNVSLRKSVELSAKKLTPKSTRKSPSQTASVTPAKNISPRKSVGKATPAKGKLSAKKLTPKSTRKSPSQTASVTPAKNVSPRKSVGKATPAKGKLSAKKLTPKSATKSPSPTASVTPAKNVSPRKSVGKATPAKGKLSAKKLTPKSTRKSPSQTASVTPAKNVSPRKSVGKATPAKGKLSAKKLTPKSTRKSPSPTASTSAVTPLRDVSFRRSVGSPVKEALSPKKLTPVVTPATIPRSVASSRMSTGSKNPRKSIGTPTPAKGKLSAKKLTPTSAAKSPSRTVSDTKLPEKTVSSRRSVGSPVNKSSFTPVVTPSAVPSKIVHARMSTGGKPSREFTPAKGNVSSLRSTPKVSPRKSVGKATPAKGTLSAKKLTPKTVTKSPLPTASVSAVTPISPRRSFGKPVKTFSPGKFTPVVRLSRIPGNKSPLQTATTSSPRRRVGSPVKEALSPKKLTPVVSPSAVPFKVVDARMSTGGKPSREFTPAAKVNVSPLKSTPKVSPRKSFGKATPAKGTLSAKKVTPKTATKSPLPTASVSAVTPKEAVSPRKSVGKPVNKALTANTSPLKSARKVSIAKAKSSSKKQAAARLASRKATPIRVPFSGGTAAKSPVRAQKRGRSTDPDAKLGGKPAKIRKLESPKTLDKKKMAALFVVHHKAAPVPNPSSIVYETKLPKSFNFNSKVKGSKIPLFGAGKQQAKSPKSVGTLSTKAVSASKRLSGRVADSPKTPIADQASTSRQSPAKSAASSGTPSPVKSARKSDSLVLSAKKATPLSVRKSTPKKSSTPVRSSRKSSVPRIALISQTPESASKSAKATPVTIGRPKQSSTPATADKSVKPTPVTVGRPKQSSTPATADKSVKPTPVTVGRPSKSSTPLSVARTERDTSLLAIPLARKSTPHPTRKSLVTPISVKRSSKKSLPSIVLPASPAIESTPLRGKKSAISSSFALGSLVKSSAQSPEKSLVVENASSSATKSGKKSIQPKLVNGSAKSSSSKKGHPKTPANLLVSTDMFYGSSSSNRRLGKRPSVEVIESPEIIERDAKKRLFSVLALSPGKTPPTGSAKRNSASRPSTATKKTPGSIAKSQTPLNRASQRSSLQQLFQSPEVVVRALSLSAVKTPLNSSKNVSSPLASSSARSAKDRTPSANDSIANSTLESSAFAAMANVFKTPQSPRYMKRVASSARPRMRLSTAKSPLVYGSPVASTSRASLAGRMSVDGTRASLRASVANSSGYDLIDLTTYDFDAVSTPNVRKEMLVSPGGIVQKSPKNSLSLVEGMKKLFQEKVLQKSPKNDLSDVFGVRRLMKTVPSPNFADVSTLGSLFDSPNVSTKRKAVQFNHPDSPDVHWLSPPKRLRRNAAAEPQPTSVAKKGKAKASPKTKASPKPLPEASTPSVVVLATVSPKSASKAKAEIPKKSPAQSKAGRKGKGATVTTSPAPATGAPNPLPRSRRGAPPVNYTDAQESPKPTPGKKGKPAARSKTVEESPAKRGRSKATDVVDLAEESSPAKNTPLKSKDKADKRVAEKSPAAKTIAPRSGRPKATEAATQQEPSAAKSPKTKTVAARRGRAKAADVVDVAENSPKTKTVAARKPRGVSAEDVPAASPKLALKRAAADDSPVPRKIGRRGKADPSLPAVSPPKTGRRKAASPAEAKTVSPRKTRGKTAVVAKKSPVATPKKGRGRPAAKSAESPAIVPSPKEAKEAKVEPKRGKRKAVAEPAEEVAEDVVESPKATKKGKGKAPAAKKAMPKKRATRRVAASSTSDSEPSPKKASPEKKASPVKKATLVKKANSTKKGSPEKEASPAKKASPEKKATPAKKGARGAKAAAASPVALRQSKRTKK